ncbi:helix-turn-helix domain-containing protein [Microbulbifer sp. THAF38]|uniref:helix-turn-helix domain-containing protein n=1 Tax=Microbulbifer sp. THAF38 TaxID=2587856 RepID=UPI001268E4E2|nr:helix-turn-helix domain-containing protein [Microbulbifer sp. THAF38]QFT53872.1 Cytoskeleton protein RodZ [Microbulbifer sp. THAF38]
MTDSNSVHRDSGQTESNTQVSPGALLLAAREAAGLSREELSRRLCIIDNTVEWLETDLYERQPEAVYARGYIRNICRELSIDSTTVLAAYDAARPKPQARRESRRIEIRADSLRPASKRGHGLLALLPLVAAGAVFWWLYDGPVNIPGLQTPTEQSAEQNRPLAEATEPSVTSSESEFSGPSSTELQVAAAPEQQPQLAVEEMVEEAQAPEPNAPSELESEPSEQTAEAAAQLPAAVAQLDEQLQGALRLSFDEDAWVEVKDAEGVVLLAGVQQAGTSKSLDGRAPFEVMLGNARGTRVVYREQTIESDPIGSRRTRRLIVGN